MAGNTDQPKIVLEFIIQDTAMLGVFMYALFVIFTLTLSVLLLAGLKWRGEDGKGRVAVIVLGDLGRSPRMQYHALSLCREGYEVEFVGYGGTKVYLSLYVH